MAGCIVVASFVIGYCNDVCNSSVINKVGAHGRYDYLLLIFDIYVCN